MASAQKVSAQTSAVLKSTGGAAGVTAKHVDALATSLLNLSGVDDEAIKSGENVLLTFTNIRNQAGKGNRIFDQATKAALDLSVAFGTDLQGASIQVGKALQDPVRGVTALRRAGVSFTNAQQKQIKALVGTGHTLEAQKLILRELTKEFGGSAKAAGDTLAGKLNILHQTALNLGGTLAQTLTPEITRLVDNLTKWLQSGENQRRVLDDVRQAAGALSDIVKALKTAFEGLNTITGSTKDTVKLLFGAFVAFKTFRVVSMIGEMATNMGLFAANSRRARIEAERMSKVPWRWGPGGALIPGGNFGAGVAGAALAIGQRGETARPSGPLQVAGLADVVTYFDAIAGSYQMIRKGKGETAEQAAIRDFRRRHPEASRTRTGEDIRARATARGAFFTPRLGAGGAIGAGVPGRLGYTGRLAKLDLAFAKTQLTQTQRDDRAVLVQMAALDRERLTKVKTLKDRTAIYQHLAGVEQQIAGIDDTARQKQLDANQRAADAAKAHAAKLRAQAAAIKTQLRSAVDNVISEMGRLFDVFVPDDPAKGILGVVGGTVTAKSLTAKLKAQTDQVVKFNKDLSRLARRGAPPALIESLRAQGLAGAMNVHALATAGRADLNTFLRQYNRRQRVAQQIAHADIRMKSASIYIGNARPSATTPSTQRRGRQAGVFNQSSLSYGPH